MKYLVSYLNTFAGLSKSVWFLALVTLVNRAGTMVIPFLSIYLAEDLDFTKPQIALVLVIFGLGSLIGSWIGGKLSDKIGFYNTMVGSLFLTGIAFILLQFLTEFLPFCAGVFVLMIIADAFRPASFASIISYSKPEDKTRSVTLIRLAINLGMMAGPLAAGFIIEARGYSDLFWIDGITCMLATFLIIAFLRPKESRIKEKSTKVEGPKSNVLLSDPIYVQFLLVIVLIGFVFMQLFSIIPLFYKEIMGYSESLIGKIMLLNGLIIVLLEMPLINYFENKKMAKLTVIQISIALLGISYLVLIISSSAVIILISILFITVGEMLAFPFSNALAMDKAPKNQMGTYMGLYTMAFSLSHIIGPGTGMYIAGEFGYNACWILMVAVSLAAIFLTQDLKKRIDKKNSSMVGKLQA